MGLVDDDLVDDDLGEERCGEADQLDGQAGEQDVTPDGFVLEEFGDEPFEAEFFLLDFKAGDFAILVGAVGFARGEDEFGFELGGGFVDGDGFRGLATGAEIQEFVTVGFEDEDRDGRNGFFGIRFRDGTQEGHQDDDRGG